MPWRAAMARYCARSSCGPGIWSSAVDGFSGTQLNGSRQSRMIPRYHGCSRSWPYVRVARSVLNSALFMNSVLNSHLQILFRLE
eukprot:345782-Prymnesium_polylepis.1